MLKHASKTWWILSLFLCPFWAWAQDAVPGLPLSVHYPSQVYEGGSQNWQIVQGKRGFLYVANHFGLLEFDGNEWALYRLVPQSSILSLALGEGGKIYVGGQNKFGYFASNSSGLLVFSPLQHLLPVAYRDFDEVWNVYPTEDGVYFCTHKYIFFYDGAEIKAISHPTGILYAYYSNYSLYVSGWEDGLLRLEGDKLIPVEGGGLFRNKTIRALFPFNKKEHLIATQEGEIYLYDGEGFKPWMPSKREVFKKAQIICVKRLKDGRIAIGTQNQGLFILSQSGEIVYHLDRDKGLLGHSAYGLYEDDLGNLWVALSNGLSYVYLGAPFTLIDENSGVKGPGYAAISYQNNLYLGTKNGAYKQAGAEFVEVPQAEGHVYHLSEHKGKLLLGHHNGPFELRGDKFYPLSKQQGAWKFMTLNGQTDRMIQGHYQGFYSYQWDGANWEFRGPIKGFGESARLFYEDENGEIWMSHGFKGVFRIKLNEEGNEAERIEAYQEAAGLPSHALINIFRVNNKFVFGTTDGPYVYDSKTNTFAPDSMLAPLVGQAQRLTYMDEDTDGNIFFLQEGGMGVLERKANGNYKVSKSQFELINSMISDDLEAIYPIDQKNVFITAKEGFIRYDPSIPTLSRDSISLFVREIAGISSDKVWYRQAYEELASAPKVLQLTLPYHQRAVIFRVSSPSLEAAGRMLYRFKIKGLEKEWTNWSKAAEREINGLPAGSHSIWASVKVDGKIETRKIVELKILPPWYASLWMKIIYFLLAAGLLSYLALWTIKRFQKVKQAITLDKEQAIESKRKEIEQLTEASEAAIENVQQEKLESELAFKNQELTSVTMHLLAKNAFLQRISKDLDELKEKDKKQQGSMQGALKKLTQKIHKNLNDEDEWERFSYHFSQVHGDFFSKLKKQFPDLTPQELKLCGYLKMNMTTKEIAQLLNISVRGVESSRYRLRKKLGVKQEVNLVDFMMQN